MKYLLLSAVLILVQGCSNQSNEFHLAARNGRIIALEAMLGGTDVDEVQEPVNNTALHESARSGQARTVDFLLDAGADIDAQNSVGCTPLYYAVLGVHPEVVAILLHRGADPTIRTNGRAMRARWTPYEYAVEFSDFPGMADVLLVMHELGGEAF